MPFALGGRSSRAGIMRPVATIEASGRFRRQPAGAGRALYAAEPPGRAWIDIAGWVAGDLPEVLQDPRFEPEAGAPGRWQLVGAQGEAGFVAGGVTLLEPRPELLGPLGAAFALKPGERRAARVLLALLRLPGGARLLRAWHARRG